MGEVSYNWIGERVRIKDSLQFVHVVVKILNFVISRSSFDECGREMLKNACRTCNTIILVLSTNNITAFWCCRFLNSLLSSLKTAMQSNSVMSTRDRTHCLSLPGDGSNFDHFSRLQTEKEVN